MLGKPHHYGVTVSDIETMQEFYVDCLGMEEVMRDTLDGEVVSEITGVEGPREVSFLQAEEFGVELIEYHSPGGKNANEGVRNCDVGAAHFCIEVEDVRELYDELSDDIEFISPPQEVGSGAWSSYAFDPDGNVVELGSIGLGE
jgi:catechol 2,3-dioxygenase-like lactoylglutathione lyase family enzyme